MSYGFEDPLVDVLILDTLYVRITMVLLLYAKACVGMLKNNLDLHEKIFTITFLNCDTSFLLLISPVFNVFQWRIGATISTFHLSKLACRRLCLFNVYENLLLLEITAGKLARKYINSLLRSVWFWRNFLPVSTAERFHTWALSCFGNKEGGSTFSKYSRCCVICRSKFYFPILTMTDIRDFFEMYCDYFITVNLNQRKHYVTDKAKKKVSLSQKIRITRKPQTMKIQRRRLEIADQFLTNFNIG